LSALSCHVFESKQAIASSDMQPYVFTYNFNQQVDPVAKQYNATRQTLDYVLALDIQDQVYSHLNTIVEANNSMFAMKRAKDNSKLSLSEYAKDKGTGVMSLTLIITSPLTTFAETLDASMQSKHQFLTFIATKL
jgi:hypothetical protein